MSVIFSDICVVISLLQIARGLFILISMMNNRQRELISCAGLLLITIIWGFSFVVIKNSLDFITPMYMLAVRFTIAGVGLILIFPRKTFRASKASIKHGALIGLMLFLAEVFQTYGINHTTAGKNAFLTTFYVIMVPVLHLIFNHKRPDRICIIASVMAFVGLGMISLNGEKGILLGDWLTLICGIFYAAQIVLIARYALEDDPIVISIYQIVFAAIYSLIFAPITEGLPSIGMFGRDSVVGLLYIGLLSTLLCFLVQNICQKYAPPAPSAIIMSFESVFGAVFSAIFLKERMTTKMIIGCVIMFVSVVLIEMPRKNGQDKLKESEHAV